MRTVTGAPLTLARTRLRSSHSPAHRVASSAAAPMLAQKLGPEVMLLVEAAAPPAIAPPPKEPALAAAEEETLGAAPGVAPGVAEAQAAAAGGEGEPLITPGVPGALPAEPAALLAVLGALPAEPAEPLRTALSVGVVAAGLPLDGGPCVSVPEAMGVAVEQTDRLLLPVLLLLAPRDRVAVGEPL